jgi:hypothetical protein
VSEQTRPETAIATLDQPRRRPDMWPIDMLKGAVIGDYAKRLGVPGYVTQGVLEQLAKGRGRHELCGAGRHACLFDRSERALGASGGERSAHARSRSPL